MSVRDDSAESEHIASYEICNLASDTRKGKQGFHVGRYFTAEIRFQLYAASLHILSFCFVKPARANNLFEFIKAAFCESMDIVVFFKKRY